MQKILLNYLPPSDIYTPSAALSILKSFMLEHDFDTDIKYWNLLFKPVLPLQDSDEIEEAIIPFVSILNDQFTNDEGNDKAAQLLHSLLSESEQHDLIYYKKLLISTKKDIFRIINKELSQLNFSDILLFGVSSKFHQWIPGMILCQEVKKISPNTATVVGGFGSVQSAVEAMKMNPDFDFATWGEGEYPLLELSKQLKASEQDFNEVPRLIFRENGKIQISTTNRSEYLDMQDYMIPNYDDYFENYPVTEEKYKIVIPINSSRACSWNKCKFCDYNRGYKYRARTAECIISEVEQIARKHKSACFSFVDNDIYVNPEHFEHLLDLMIESINKHNFDYEFWAEMIPNEKLTAPTLKKMQQAGFSQIFDTLLEKMAKSNTFSSNILFLKFSLKNEIYPLVNIIKGVLGETAGDVIESMANLYFLRFFYNKEEYSLYHEYVTLVVSNMTKYYTMLSAEQRAEYNTNKLTDMLPRHFSEGDSRFSLFRWQKQKVDNHKQWAAIQLKEEYYAENIHTYKINEQEAIIEFTEFVNDKHTATYKLDKETDWQILKLANEQIMSFEDMLSQMQTLKPDFNSEDLKKHLSRLKEIHLLYCDKNFSGIISVIG
ncbi:MAG: hypothetical protein B6I18_00225 [Bacteroidetes bacterium 4572_112]|nr:MAG: hypothetical protein B6I18_00225 [Bacteroidetes bacterium 4572_112]